MVTITSFQWNNPVKNSILLSYIQRFFDSFSFGDRIMERWNGVSDGFWRPDSNPSGHLKLLMKTAKISSKWCFATMKI